MSVISIESAEHYKWGDNCDSWHLVKSRQLSVIQERVPSGCSETRHFHNVAEQFFFVLSGVGTLDIGDDIFMISSQQGIHVPAGISHKLSNQHSQDLIFTVTSTPPSHGDKVVV